MAWVSISFFPPLADHSKLGYRRSHLSTQGRHVRRTARAISMVTAKTPFDEAYKKFSNLVNDQPSDPSPTPEPDQQPPQPATEIKEEKAPSTASGNEPLVPPKKPDQETLKAQYSEFAQRLQIEDDINKEEEGLGKPRKAVEKAKAKPVEIDPADYNIFNSMLQRSGGMGHKSLKGGKRFVTTASPPSIPDDIPFDKSLPQATPPSSSESLPLLKKPMRPTSSLTPEQAAEGYAMLAAEFGPGFRTPDNKPTIAPPPTKPIQESVPVPALQRPPSRPSDLADSQASVDVPKHLFDSTISVPSAEPPLPPPEDLVLQPRPIVPGQVSVQKEQAEPENDPGDFFRDPGAKLPSLDQAPKPPLQQKPDRPSVSPPPQPAQVADASKDSGNKPLDIAERKILETSPKDGDDSNEEYLAIVDELLDEDSFSVGVDSDGFSTVSDGFPASEDSKSAADENEESLELPESNALHEKPNRQSNWRERTLGNVRFTSRRPAGERQNTDRKEKEALVLKNPKLLVSK